MQIKIMVIVVVYNNKQITLNFLDSLKKVSIPKKCDIELLIIDNGSDDPFDEAFDLGFLHSTIRIEKNIGFGGGANLGINNAIDASVDYIWLLNNDVVLSKDCLNDAVKLLPEFDGISFAMHNPDGTLETSGLGEVSFLNGRGKKSSEKLEVDNNSYFNFAAIILSSKVIRSVGGFDSENFFLYWEDVDLSIRIIQKKFKVCLLSSQIIHYSGSTNNKYSFDTAYHYNKSAIIFFRKHGIKFLGIVAPFIVFHLRFIKRLVTFQLVKALGTIIGGYSGLFYFIKSK